MAIRLFQTGRASRRPVAQLMLSESEVHHYLCQAVEPEEFEPSGLELARRESAQCCLSTLDNFPHAALLSFPKRQFHAAEQELRTLRSILSAPVPTNLDEALEVLHTVSWPYRLGEAKPPKVMDADVLPSTPDQRREWDKKVAAASRVLFSYHADLVKRCGGQSRDAVVKVTAEQLDSLRRGVPEGLSRSLLGTYHQSTGGLLHLPGYMVKVWEEAGLFTLAELSLWAHIESNADMEVLQTLLSDRTDRGQYVTSEEFREYAQLAAALTQ